MKYLKKFNESSESIYYEEIFGTDPILNHDTNDELRFTNDEVDTIKSLYYLGINTLNPIVITLKGWGEGAVVFNGNIVNEISIKDMFDTYHIYKYDDEWYILSVKKSNFEISTARDVTKYYKCDQFDGLLKCLKDKTPVNN